MTMMVLKLTKILYTMLIYSLGTATLLTNGKIPVSTLLPIKIQNFIVCVVFLGEVAYTYIYN